MAHLPTAGGITDWIAPLLGALKNQVKKAADYFLLSTLNSQLPFPSPARRRKKGFLRDLSLKRGFQGDGAPLVGVWG